MKAEKKRTLRDVCLIAMLLLIGILMLIPKGDAGRSAEIRLDGKLYGNYSLDEDREISIERDGTVLGVAVIEDGKIFMKSAACEGGDCIKRGAAETEGECILCLPSGISITVGGKGLDGVTG